MHFCTGACSESEIGRRLRIKSCTRLLRSTMASGRATGVTLEDGGGVTLEFQNLRFAVGDKPILKGVSATLHGGEVVAILGPSGAGKTSLMNILAGRVTSNKARKIEGKIMLDGENMDPSSRAFRSRIAYVMQEDALMPFATPRESLRFSCKLRRAADEPSDEKERVVERMIKALRLEECADTIVGNDMVKGISGGEKKRASIGVELVTDPSIVFLDEPTSGLDSYAAMQVVKQLKEVASDGRLVVCTIHQPSSEIFELFDRVLLVSHGELLFTDAMSALAPTWARAGFPFPPQHNPADFVMFKMQTEPHEELQKVVDAQQPALPGASRAGGAKPPSGRPRSSPPAASRQRTLGGLLGVNDEHRVVQASWPMQLRMLFVREVLNTFRNYGGIVARYAIPLVLNVIYGIIFFQAARLDDKQSHFGALVNAFISIMFGSAQPMLIAFPVERPIFLREYAAGSYSATAYFLSKVALELPLAFANALSTWLVLHWMIGFTGNFILLVLACWILALIASSTALLVGSMLSNIEEALNTVRAASARCALQPPPLHPRQAAHRRCLRVCAQTGPWTCDSDATGADHLRATAAVRRLLHQDQPDPRVRALGAVPLRAQVRAQPSGHHRVLRVRARGRARLHRPLRAQ